MIREYLISYQSTSGLPVFCYAWDENKKQDPDMYGTCINYPELYEAILSWDFPAESVQKELSLWLEKPNTMTTRILARVIQNKLKI